MNEIKLLPCPFCNGEVNYIPNPSQVWCRECLFQIEDECKEAVVKRWNTRTPQGLEPLDRDKLAKLLAHSDEPKVSWEDWSNQAKIMWIKKANLICQTFGSPALDVEKILSIMNSVPACHIDSTREKDFRNIAQAISDAHQRGELNED